MDAVEYLKAVKSICDHYIFCSECILNKNGCAIADTRDPKDVVADVEKWWDENKPKTNAEWVREKLEEIGFTVDFKSLAHKCPPKCSRTFGYRKMDCEQLCSECLKWWDEIHKEGREEDEE